MNLKRIVFLYLFLAPVIVYAQTGQPTPCPEHRSAMLTCQAPAEGAKKKRAEKVTHYKEDLVRRTIEAHGGEYRRTGRKIFLKLNGRIYSDATLQVIDGKYLIIHGNGDIIRLDIVDE